MFHNKETSSVLYYWQHNITTVNIFSLLCSRCLNFVTTVKHFITCSFSVCLTNNFSPNDIVIISIITILNLMSYHDMEFLISYIVNQITVY